jgi:hypothetical protein
MQHSLYSIPQIIDNYDNTYIPTPEIMDKNIYYNYDTSEVIKNDSPSGIYQSEKNDLHITFSPNFIQASIDEENNSCYHNIIHYCWTF